jgi:hypothetical protein
LLTTDTTSVVISQTEFLTRQALSYVSDSSCSSFDLVGATDQNKHLKELHFNLSF